MPLLKLGRLFTRLCEESINERKSQNMKVLFHKHSIAETVAGLALCIALFSCTGKEFIDREDDCRITAESDKICFGVTGIEGKLTKAGSAAGNAECKYPSRQFVMRSTDTDDTLCVTVEMSEGIAASSGSGAITRSAPVTSINEYGNFRVQALYRKEETPSSITFYMDDTVEDFGNGTWGTVNSTYYWPGAGRTLQFYAWAPAVPAEPAESGMTEPNSVEKMVLEYEVPERAVDQKDIIVAVTGEVTGDYNDAVSLEFKHVCTAVRFVAGDVLQPGAIKSVSLKNVKCSGSYDMTTDTWALNDGVADFSQTFTAQETNTGDEIVTGENTFMMLPQTLPDGAVVEVVFQNRGETETRTLQASIAGTEWPMGMTVTYKLSITPEYELEFVSKPEIQDAHYVIYPITIRASDDVPGGWTLTSTDDNVTLCTKLSILANRGFWIEEDKGGESISGTAGENIEVYAFLTENIGEETRTINLELRPTDLPDAEPVIFTISQLCPSWNGDLGCERIEDGDYPWGFLWSSDLKITYDILGSDLDLIGQAILTFYLELFDNSSFIQQDWGLIPLRNYVIIDFSAISSVKVADDPDNGRSNTLGLYNFDGLNDASSLMQYFQENGVTADITLPVNPTNFAARMCALKNKFNKEIDEDNNVERPVLKEENLVWYLPAKNETSRMLDAEYQLGGKYWTSTSSGNDNENAYIYDVEANSTYLVKRDLSHHVRAVRKKP